MATVKLIQPNLAAWPYTNHEKPHSSRRPPTEEGDAAGGSR